MVIKVQLNKPKIAGKENLINNITAAIKEKIKEENANVAQIKEEVFNLGVEDEAPPIEKMQHAITVLNGLCEEQDIPVNSIRVGLKSVMGLLKQYDDIVLELEPEDISSIVQSYMMLADEETRTIFDKAAKKAKKRSKGISVKTGNIVASAEEDIDLSGLDLG